MPQNPCQTAWSILAFIVCICAKQRTLSKPFHSRPNCCIFLQQTAPFSPIGERTFSSFVRLTPCLGRKNRRSPQAAPAGCPAGQMTASRTPHPNRAALPPPLDRETPAPGIFPFCLYLENHTARFPAMEKGPRLYPEAFEWVWFIPRSVPFPAGTPGRCHRVPHRSRRPAGSSPASRRR